MDQGVVGWNMLRSICNGVSEDAVLFGFPECTFLRFHIFSSTHLVFAGKSCALDRKHLGNVSSICRMNWVDFLSGGLVLFQSCGEQFTNDAKKYFGDVSPTCPFCQNCDDSGLHRFEECTFFQPVRQEFPLLFTNWSSLPMQAKTYSFWPEPPMYDQFWAFYIAFHSHIFIDQRTTTFTLHLLMDHANGRKLWHSYQLLCGHWSARKSKQCGDPLCLDIRATKHRGGKSLPVLLRWCVSITFAFLQTTRPFSRLPRKSFTATVCSSPSTFLKNL